MRWLDVITYSMGMSLSKLKLELVKQWLKQHPGYKVLDTDENIAQDPLRMFVPD